MTGISDIAGAKTIELEFDMMPRATFCQPQIASFGFTEKQARERGYEINVAKFPFTANGKAQGLADPVGIESDGNPAHPTLRRLGPPPALQQ